MDKIHDRGGKIFKKVNHRDFSCPLRSPGLLAPRPLAFVLAAPQDSRDFLFQKILEPGLQRLPSIGFQASVKFSR